MILSFSLKFSGRISRVLFGKHGWEEISLYLERSVMPEYVYSIAILAQTSLKNRTLSMPHRMWLRAQLKRSQINGLDLWEPVTCKLRLKRQYCGLLYVLPLKSYCLKSIRSPVSFESDCPEIQVWQVVQFQKDRQRWQKRTDCQQYYCGLFLFIFVFLFLSLSLFSFNVPFTLSFQFWTFFVLELFSLLFVFSDHFICSICRICSI